MATVAKGPGVDAAESPKHSLRWLLAAQFFGSLALYAWIQIVAIAQMSRAASGGAADSALAWIQALVLVPLVPISFAAGALADRSSKRSVIIAAALLEVGVVAAGASAFFVRPAGETVALVVLMSLSLQAAIGGPAKFGILPELLPHERLSAGNGRLELSGNLAMCGGIIGAGAVLWLARDHAWVLWLALIGVSALGLVGASHIPRFPLARTEGGLIVSIRAAWSAIGTDRILRLAVAGQVCFWTIASLIPVALNSYAKRTLRLDDGQASVPLAAGGIGIAIGALLAGRLSGAKVEYGLLPLGALGLTGVTLALAIATPGLPVALLLMLLGGSFSGLLVVPLNALLQWRAPADHRGTVIGMSNAFAFAGMLVGSLVLLGLFGAGLSARGALVLAALAFAGTALWALWLLPDAFLRFLLLVLAATLYRVKVLGRENVPRHGGALLTPNHVSFADGLFLISAIDRPVRFVVYAGYFHHPLLGPFLRALGAIPISGRGGPKQILQAFREAGHYLDEGHLVCIFPEGQITRTGTLQPFQRGMQRILKGRSVPVIPVHLDRATASIFSPTHAGPLPERIHLPVTVSFGAPLPSETPLHLIQQRIHDLDQEAWEYRKPDCRPLHHGFIRRARQHPLRLAFADLERPGVSGISALVEAIALARALRPFWAGQQNIGILLPAGTAAALANVAVSLASRTAVNLNFSRSGAELESATRQAGLRVAITSRAFVEKAGVVVPGAIQPIWLEDVAQQIGRTSRLTALALAWAAPIPIIERAAGSVRRPTVDDVATVLFTSGRTDEPKGVVLSHFNIDSNLAAIAQVFRVRSTDRLLGVLPLFHAFGYTSFWLAGNYGIGTVFHGDSSDAATVGALADRHRATILLATPSLLSLYKDRCPPAQFGSIRLVIAGAETLPAGAAEAFEDHFGIRPLEGYGMTECSPVVAVSTPDFRAPGFFQPGSRRGCVGRVLPGVSVQVVEPETFIPVDPGNEGILLVKGPNVMKGYLGRDDLTRSVLHDGWYVTGDLGIVDEDGFLKITGRSSRSSKTGDALVAHDRLESQSKTQ